MEDKVVFEQAFRYHGKHFQRIRSMVNTAGGLKVVIISLVI